ncbi:hypothetical protein N7448_009110 [Penicillium atrosanguineum]|uniref:Secreted protein n=1 Tax=Penicillium atrosanguineum TaxID=1132637 RepID=A0A9W9GK94_9EURO|nr:Aspartate aminotransferase cytoplasmic [Penicillium atrosanguineum]KAJ5123013.1 hypothetical protein N7448_009110 [Penicillium atrosanguineum]KAJ5141645.1 hypothetical protein N7526_002640 [Penicillium atrosanguineum]KAJ5298236.1 Aspartate aminotransferase cytoplasmic [Penicillium atrosanguineum]KAJ5321497.1 hypothetical protein N7476_004499 [Penicillium atrosanguineum]
MNLQAGLYVTVLALLALPGLVSGYFIASAIPVISSPIPSAASPLASPAGKGHWEFDLYKDTKCTRTARTLKGDGSYDCRTDVPSGGAKGYNVKTLDFDCTVTLYQDSVCSQKKKITTLLANNQNMCSYVGGFTKKVKGYKVRCS